MSLHSTVCIYTQQSYSPRIYSAVIKTGQETDDKFKSGNNSYIPSGCSMPKPDLEAELNADRTNMRAGQEPTVEGAYHKMLSETAQTEAHMTPAQKRVFSNSLSEFSTPQMGDLALGYAKDNFKTLSHDSGNISKAELEAQRDKLKGRAPESEMTGGLPAAVESKLLNSLIDRYDELRKADRPGLTSLSHWMDRGISMEALNTAIENYSNRRKLIVNPPLRPDQKGDGDLSNMPAGVPELFKAAGVEIKSQDQPVSEALADKAKDSPVISISQAFYNPETREIFAERSKTPSEAKLHETGHAVDDALKPGPGFFTDGKEYNQAVDADLKELPNLDYSKIMPRLHVFVQAGLSERSLTPRTRKELFAELYQAGDENLAQTLRQYFPRTAALVDKTLKEQGIGRAPRT